MKFNLPNNKSNDNEDYDEIDGPTVSRTSFTLGSHSSNGERDNKFNELATLTNFLQSVLSKENPIVTERAILRAQLAIEQLLYTLYPINSIKDMESDMNAMEDVLDELYPEGELQSPEVIVKDEVQEDELEDALEQRKYHFMSDIIVMLTNNPGLKAARESWDNGLNEEYIIYMDNVGVVKVFNSVKIADFKYVKHMFKPSELDKSEKDWYILNEVIYEEKK